MGPIFMTDNLILVFGITGLVGSVSIAIADLLMLLSRKQIPMIDRVGDVWLRAPTRVFIGGPAAVAIVFPMWAAGMVPVTYGLLGSWMSWPAVIGLCAFAYAGSFAHGLFPIVGALIGVQERYKDDPSASQALAEIRSVYDNYFRFTVYVTMIILLVGSIFFSLAVWSGETQYPRSFAIANPFLWILFHMSTLKWWPHAISRWWRPMSVHLFYTPFYILSTYLLLNS